MPPAALLWMLTWGAAAVEVRPTSGPPVAGQLVSIGADGIAIEADGQSTTVPLDGVAVLQAMPEAVPLTTAPLAVALADGSSAAAEGFRAASTSAQVTLGGGRQVKVPVRQVAAVRLQPRDEAVDAEWNRLRVMKTESDLLVARKDAALDYHAGIVREISDDIVAFEIDGEVLPVKRSKIYGVIYHQPNADNSVEPVGQLMEKEGSFWTIASVVAKDNQITVGTPAGCEVVIPFEQLASIDFTQGKVVYLGDLEALSIQWTPFLSTGKEPASLAALFAPRRNRSLEGSPLRLAGATYAKGLAIHSRTRIEYRLPGAFRRFQATAGIDDSVRPRGHVQLTITGDGRPLLTAAIGGTDSPVPIDVDVAGVERLGFFVDYGDEMDIADHLDLADARVVK